jgi:membrane protease YdiL (CAAX protease family)
MSADSSDNEPIAAKSSPLGGFRAAVVSLLAVTGIYFVLPVIATLIVAVYPQLHGWSVQHIQNWLTHSVNAQFWYILLAEVFTIAAVLGLLKLFRWSRADIGLVKPKWHQPLLGAVAFVPYFGLYLIILAIVTHLIPSFNTSQQQQIGFNSVHGLLQMTLTFISLVILPPLAEEITMRGFLYTGLKKWLPRLVAVFLVSGLFGAAHLAEGGAAGPLWVGALDTFTLSLVLLYLREKTGNLWAGITLHAFKNGVAFVLLFVLTSR